MTTRASTSSGVGGPSRYDSWAFRRMNDERLGRLHATRARRRWAVAAHLALTAAATTGMVLLLTGQLWWTALLFGALLLWIPVTGLLNSMTRGLLELRASMLDERQLAERGVVFTLAHRTTLLVMGVAVGAFLLLPAAGTGLGELGTPLAVTGLAVAEIHWLLPMWIAALRTPDAPPDDED